MDRKIHALLTIDEIIWHIHQNITMTFWQFPKSGKISSNFTNACFYIIYHCYHWMFIIIQLTLSLSIKYE